MSTTAPTPEQVEQVAHLLNNINTRTNQYGVGDIVAALLTRVAQLEADVAALKAG